ncbi:MAG: hypothetical protein KGM96_03735 [Acidobacteriota bacterium]|nr:hypothetical protein [Acidobacteriota bacterium]
MMRWPANMALLGILAAALPGWAGGKPKPCVSAGQATKMVNKDVCVTAHI